MLHVVVGAEEPDDYIPGSNTQLETRISRSQLILGSSTLTLQWEIDELEGALREMTIALQAARAGNSASTTQYPSPDSVPRSSASPPSSGSSHQAQSPEIDMSMFSSTIESSMVNILNVVFVCLNSNSNLGMWSSFLLWSPIRC